MDRTPNFAPNRTKIVAGVDARCFVDLAQGVTRSVRACGLVAPGFQTLPRLSAHSRVLRRSRRGAIVAIRTQGKSADEVRADMIEGVVRLHASRDEEEMRELRERLVAAACAESTGPTGVPVLRAVPSLAA